MFSSAFPLFYLSSSNGLCHSSTLELMDLKLEGRVPGSSAPTLWIRVFDIVLCSNLEESKVRFFFYNICDQSVREKQHHFAACRSFLIIDC